MASPTFYWYDYETWGSDSKIDRPCQFAGVRTDLNLNIVSRHLSIYCKPPSDLLPSPDACAITGIDPAYADKIGLPEHKFAALILHELIQANTCTVGYSNLSFDDEVTRYLLYRNLYDPYIREYANGNSRWDLINVARACFALRPEGINWPINEDNNISFKLQDLARANDIEHSPHDALSDVNATLGLARLIKTKQPEIFQTFFRMRLKSEVNKLIRSALFNKMPLIHISFLTEASKNCATLILPIVAHPIHKTKIICIDLSANLQVLLETPMPVLKEIIESKPNWEAKKMLGLRDVAINKCPTLCKIDDHRHDLERIIFDLALCRENYKALKSHSDLNEKILALFGEITKSENSDPEMMLYDYDFMSDSDKKQLQKVPRSLEKAKEKNLLLFEATHLNELFFRYIARNFPEILSREEIEKWQHYCYTRLTQPAPHTPITATDYRSKLIELSKEEESHPAQLILQLFQHLNKLLSSCSQFWATSA